ncbi:ferritin family protein [Oscillospiraceae bacterium MB08-C2-2]|nr:ferritin family protein [Oscillospiraceae bacterium MB08-C2-2]
MAAIAFQAPTAYPTLQGLQKNQRDGRLLLKAYCGRNSEMTTICQYQYHQIKAAMQYPDIAAAYQGIIRVELVHFQLLGQCINLLGVNPQYRIFCNNKPVFWNGNCVSYCSTVQGMLMADIENEQQSITQYRQISEQVSGVPVRQLLGRIIEDEHLHQQIFTDLYNQYFY